MKVALILTGHARNYLHCFASIKRFLLDQYNTDVYISTWDMDSPGHGHQRNFVFAPGLDLSPLTELYPAAKIHVENHNDYVANRYPKIDFMSMERKDDIVKTEGVQIHGSVEMTEFWLERFRDQWYMVKKGWQLIENPVQYDVIMRLRLDNTIHSLTLNPTDTISFPFINADRDRLMSDHSAYGRPATMEKYCAVFDHYESMYKNNNINIAWAERMMNDYIGTYCGLPIQMDPGFTIGL
jgi:hypothetical protein